jgi:hypothetical protein
MAVAVGSADRWIRVEIDGKLYAIPLRPIEGAVALTQAEMEAMKPGPIPIGSGKMDYCDSCRLSPPFGYRNEEGSTFLCNSCWKKKMGKK